MGPDLVTRNNQIIQLDRKRFILIIQGFNIVVMIRERDIFRVEILPRDALISRVWRAVDVVRGEISVVSDT